MQGSKPTVHRRDDRAEPDDDEESAGASRIDVVAVDSMRGDSATSGMVALRRELAKLNQQAAAVEKSLDDQRRERSESLERLEKERLHAAALETRVAGAEAEAALIRKAHELAVAEMRAAHEMTLTELRVAREERAAFEKAAETASAAANDVRARSANDEAEAKAARDELAKQASELATANAELAGAKEQHAKAVAALASATEQHATLDADLAKANEEHTRDRKTASERIAVLERAADEASAATKHRQSELDAARSTEVRLGAELQGARQNAELLSAQLDAARENEEKLGRQLETALTRAAEAESQALAISLSHASLEGSVRALRDEITEAFARVGAPAAATATPSHSVPSAPVVEEPRRSMPPPSGYEPTDPKFDD